MIIDCTVAIPTIGRIEMLTQCVDSIVGGSVKPAELLILDQSNSTIVAEQISSRRDLTIKVQKCEGKGIARNMNLALICSSFDKLFVTHDDCAVSSDWLECAFSNLENIPGGMVTGRVLPGGDDPLSVPSTITWNEFYDYTGTAAHGVLYPNNMGFYRHSAIEAGGFDERDGFLTAAEDLDFSYRWLKSGRSLHYCPSMVVTHNDWRSSEQLVTLYKHYARCAGRYYAKHLYEGDSVPFKQGVRDIKNGLIAWIEKLKNGTPRSHDQRLELPIWVPIGMVEGLLESRRIGRSVE